MPEIPHETVQPRIEEGALLLEKGRLGPGNHRGIPGIVLVREPPDDLAGLIEDLEGHLPRRGLGEPRVNRRAVRGVGALPVAGDARASVEVAGVRDRPPAAHVLVHRFLLRGPDPVGVPRREEVRRRARHLVRQLVERGQVVEDPEGTALRREHQVLLVDDQVGDGGHREVELERLPVRAVVEGDEHAVLGGGVEKPLPVGILPHRPYPLVGGDPVRPVGEQRPALPEVVGAEDVGPEVVEAEADHRDEGASRGVRRDLQDVHRPGVRHVRRSDVRPVLAGVPRDVDEPSSVPAHSTPGRCFDSASAKMVQ